jgi:hypothetical protein
LELEQQKLNLEKAEQERKSAKNELQRLQVEQQRIEEQTALYKQVMRYMDSILAGYSKVEGVKLDPLKMLAEILPKKESIR